MPVDLLPVLAVDLLVQQATACGLPEVFHVSPRSRSIAHVLLVVDLRRAGGAIMPAIDRKCFAASKRRHMAWCCVCMHVNETGHAQRLNMLKERPRKWFFRKEVDFLASLAFVVNCGHTIDLQQVQAKRFSFRVCVSLCVCVCVCLSGHKLLSHHATNWDQVCFCRQVSTR